MPTYSGTTVPGGVTFAESTVSPNDTVYVDSVRAVGATGYLDLALVPKAAGALTGHVADGTVTGGNKRGQYAVDWQRSRTAATQVASQNWSVIGGGRNNTAGGGASSMVGGGADNASNGNNSAIGGGSANSAPNTSAMVGGGENNSASGNASTIGGGYGNSVLWADGTVPGGRYGNSDLHGKFAYASGRFASTGDAQFGLSVVRGNTTSAATFILTTDGSSSRSSINHTVLATGRVYGFRINLACNSAAIGTSATAYGLFGGQWMITGLIRKAATVASTMIVGTPYVTANADASLAAVTVAVTADAASYGALQITVGGLAGTNMHWVATIQTTEVG